MGKGIGEIEEEGMGFVVVDELQRVLVDEVGGVDESFSFVLGRSMRVSPAQRWSG